MKKVLFTLIAFLTTMIGIAQASPCYTFPEGAFAVGLSSAGTWYAPNIYMPYSPDTRTWNSTTGTGTWLTNGKEVSSASASYSTTYKLGYSYYTPVLKADDVSYQYGGGYTGTNTFGRVYNGSGSYSYLTPARLFDLSSTTGVSQASSNQYSLMSSFKASANNKMGEFFNNTDVMCIDEITFSVTANKSGATVADLFPTTDAHVVATIYPAVIKNVDGKISNTADFSKPIASTTLTQENLSDISTVGAGVLVWKLEKPISIDGAFVIEVTEMKESGCLFYFRADKSATNTTSYYYNESTSKYTFPSSTSGYGPNFVFSVHAFFPALYKDNVETDTINAETESIAVTIHSNVDPKDVAIDMPDWITLDNIIYTSDKYKASEPITLNFKLAETTETREGTITINNKGKEISYTVKQEASAPQPVTDTIDNWNTLFGTSYDGSITGVKKNTDILSGTTANGVTFLVNSGASTNGYVKDADFRMYNGYTLTLTAPEGYVITNIEATKSGKTISGLTTNKPELVIAEDNASMSWNGLAKSLVFSVTATMGFGNMNITLVKGEEPVVALDSITIDGYKTQLFENAEFSFGGTVTAHYADNSTANVTDKAEFTGYDMAKLGEQEVTVSYTENEVTKTAKYNIEVVAMPKLDSINTIANIKACYDAGVLKANDTVLVKGYISNMFLKPANFAKYGSVTIWMTDTEGSEAKEFELFNCYGYEGDTLAYFGPGYTTEGKDNIDVDSVIGRAGDIYVKGQYIEAKGAFSYYNGTYELGQGCFIITESKPVEPKTPAITMTGTVGAERTISVGTKTVGDKVMLDWGDGNVIEQTISTDMWGDPAPAEFTGTPAGEGAIKIYGDAITYIEAVGRLTEGEILNAITAIDVTKATALEELYLNMNKLSSIDLSQNAALKTLNIASNLFETIDVAANPALASLTADANFLTSIDLSKNPAITTVVLSNNQIAELDFSNNPLLKTATCLNNVLTSVNLGKNTAKNHTLQFGGNKLTSISLEGLENFSGTYLRLRDNFFASADSIKLPGKIKQLWVDGNALNLVELYALKSKATTLTYATSGMFTSEFAQVPFALDETYPADAPVDLSSQAKLGETATAFTWITLAGDTLVEGTDYTVVDGVFTFMTSNDSIRCYMTNAELPNFTAAVPYVTTWTSVTATPALVPAITMTGTVGAERTISVGTKTVGDKVMLDWGDGNVIEQTISTDMWGDPAPAEFTGTPVGEGAIKIYGDAITYIEAVGKLTEGEILNAITAIDVTKATALEELYLNMNKLSSIDLSQNAALKTLNIASNLFETIDVAANPALASLTADANFFTGIDLSKNPALTTVVLSNNQIAELDFSNNPLLKTATCLNNVLTNVNLGKNTNKNHTLQFGGNKLTSISLEGLENFSGTYLRLRDNFFASADSIKLPGKIKQLWVDGNALNLVELYALKSKATTLTYATSGMFTSEFAQAPFALDETYPADAPVDLSSQAKLGETATAFTWITLAGDTLVEGTDYTVADGVFTFLTSNDSIRCYLTNAELPNFTAAVPYVTTWTSVTATPALVPAITMTGTVGAERTISVGTKTVGDKVMLDWGDGNVIEQTISTDMWGDPAPAEFTGIPAGEGAIKIYGDAITYIEAVGKLNDGDIPNAITAIDVTKATALEELYINMNKLSSIDLSQNAALKTLNIASNQFETIDLSANTALASFTADVNFFTSIDLSKNPALTTVVLSNNQIAELDFSNNPLLKTATCLNNVLTSVNLGKNTNKNHTLQFGGNKLTSISLEGLENFSGTYLRLRDNSFASADSIKLPGKIKQLWVDGNALNLVELYALKSKATTLTYATSGMFTSEFAQAPFALDETYPADAPVDLSSQAKLGETATTFVWKNAAGDVLVEDVDYTVENGVFTFITANDSIRCYLSNAELPNFTAAVPYVTTWTSVQQTTGIKNVNTTGMMNSDAIYNLNGVRVNKDYNGIVIRNGKRFINKK